MKIQFIISVSPSALINCNGLITDTLGTGDDAKIFFPNALMTNFNIVDITLYDTNNNILFHSVQDSILMPNYQWSPIASNSLNKYYYRLQTITNSNHKIGICGELYQLTCKPSNLSTLFFPDQIDPSSGFSHITSNPIPNCP